MSNKKRRSQTQKERRDNSPAWARETWKRIFRDAARWRRFQHDPLNRISPRERRIWSPTP